jgi:hypothetical protein
MLAGESEASAKTVERICLQAHGQMVGKQPRGCVVISATRRWAKGCTVRFFLHEVCVVSTISVLMLALMIYACILCAGVTMPSNPLRGRWDTMMLLEQFLKDVGFKRLARLLESALGSQQRRRPRPSAVDSDEDPRIEGPTFRPSPGPSPPFESSPDN